MNKMKKFSLDDVKEHSLIVDINDVAFNSWNPKVKRSKEYEKVYKSVETNGLSMPIVVREIEDEDFKYQVLDGEQRLTAALDLGFDKIWIVNLGQVSDDEAKAKTLWMEMAVPFEQEALGKLLVELQDKVELPYDIDEIELIAGVEVDDKDDEFEGEFSNRFKTFSLHLTPDNKEAISKFFKDKKDELSTSENVISALLIKIFQDSYDVEKYKEFIEKEQNKEDEYSSGE